MATIACFGRVRKAKYAAVISDLLVRVHQLCHLTNLRNALSIYIQSGQGPLLLPRNQVPANSSQGMHSTDGP